MIYFPNCKINIGLDILRRRADGFHDIETLMFPVHGLNDILEIVPAHICGVEFSRTGADIDSAHENNLCVRAYNLMAEEFGIGGVKIHLHKIIPAGAGLGGGSSDAAFTIKGLNRLFSLELNEERMEELAARLGSDTAFFIRNEPQIARGRGEILTPFTAALSGRRLLIVMPDVHISTAQAYGGVVPRIPAAPLEERLAVGPGGWKKTVANDFEPSLFAQYPQLAYIKRSLYGHGAEYASLSGSGSAIYGIFDEEIGDRVNVCVMELKNRFINLFVYQQLIC